MPLPARPPLHTGTSHAAPSVLFTHNLPAELSRPASDLGITSLPIELSGPGLRPVVTAAELPSFDVRSPETPSTPQPARRQGNRRGDDDRLYTGGAERGH